jgi:hypothetical protein
MEEVIAITRNADEPDTDRLPEGISNDDDAEGPVCREI